MKFKDEFSYAEVLSALALIFSAYTFYLVGKKEDKENKDKYKVSIRLIGDEMINSHVRTYDISNSTELDTCFIFLRRFLINNIGQQTLTLNTIEGDDPSSDIISLTPTINRANDTAIETFYSTRLSADSLKHLYADNHSAWDINNISNDLLNIPIEPGKSEVVSVVFIESFKVLRKQRQLHKSDSSMYYYFSNFDFNFSTDYTEKVNQLFPRQEIEEHVVGNFISDGVIGGSGGDW